MPGPTRVPVKVVAVKAVAVKVKRPDHEDPRREHWDRCALCVFRLTVICTTVGVAAGTALWGLPIVMAAFVEHIPDLFREIFEFKAEL